jgi:transcription elongation factor Elf1
MELIPLDCPSCGHRNHPLGVLEDKAEFRCRTCGMAYYCPLDYAEGPQPVDWAQTPVESTDWDISPGR